jgi:hypothetical protein
MTPAMQKRIQNFQDLDTDYLEPKLYPLVDEKEKVSRALALKLRQYRVGLQGMPEALLNYLPATHITHELFKKNGLLTKYLKHPIISNANNREKDFIQTALSHPFEFSLAMVKKTENGDFFKMFDYFKDEEYILYSPGVGKTLRDYAQNPLFLFLRTFNGECYQTFGMISYFKGFVPEDFIYFASLRNKQIKTLAQVQKHLEANPVPYYFLSQFAEYPLTFDRKTKELMLFCRRDFKVKDFETAKLSKAFQQETKNQVVKLTHKTWSDYPHLGEVYYEGKKGNLIVSTYTLKAYLKLCALLPGIEAGTPEYTATSGMLIAAEKVLGQNKAKLPCQKLFTQEATPGSKEELQKLNLFLDQLMPAFNKGEELNLEALADEYGIDRKNAKDIFNELKKMQERQGE